MMEKPDVKLKYCDCRKSNITTCGALATHKVKLCKRGRDNRGDEGAKYEYRCESCLLKGTVTYKVSATEPFDQSSNILTVHGFLTSIIGKSITSRYHTARSLIVKFVKTKGAVMCQQPITKQWKFVYFHQIDQVID